jgi:hypothetical protein
MHLLTKSLEILFPRHYYVGHMAESTEQYFDRLSRHLSIGPLVAKWRFDQLVEARRSGDTAAESQILNEVRRANARAASDLIANANAATPDKSPVVGMR